MTVKKIDISKEDSDPTRIEAPNRETSQTRGVQEDTGPVHGLDEPVSETGQLEALPQPSAVGNTQPLRQVLGKPVISVANGQKLGTVQDVLIDAQELRVAAVMLSRGGIFNHEVAAIPVSDVQAWGVHVVMVDRPDIAVPREELPGNEGWISISD